MGAEGGSEGISCQESNLPQPPRNAEPGTRGGSLVKNGLCCQNRSGRSGRGSNWQVIYAIRRCSTSPSTANFAAVISSNCLSDLVKDDRVRERVSIVQSKTKRPVQFELTENTRETVFAWVKSPEMFACRFMFPSRFHDRPHISTRQYGRLVRDWVTAIGLEPSGYGTHSLRRTKAAEIYRKTGNLRAVQLLLGHTKVDSTVRYLGVELEDALSIAERIDI